MHHPLAVSWGLRALVVVLWALTPTVGVTQVTTAPFHAALAEARRAATRGPVTPIDASALPDPQARRLAEATLRRLRFDYAGADATLDTLARAPHDPRLRAFAALGRAELSVARARADADDRLAVATRAIGGLGDARAEVELGIVAGRHWFRRGRGDSTEAILTRAGAAAAAAAPALVPVVLCQHGQSVRLSDVARAADLVRRGLAAAVRTGNRRTLGFCHLATALQRNAFGDQRAARHYATRAIADAEASHDVELAAAAWQLLAYLQMEFDGTLADARRAGETAVALGRASGNDRAAAWAHLNLARTLLRLGEPAAAWRYADTAQRMLSAQRDARGMALVTEARAEAALATGRFDVAEATYADAAARQLALGGEGNAIGAWIREAALARRRGALARADSLHDRAEVASRRGAFAGYLEDLQYERAMLDMAHGRLSRADSLLAALEVSQHDEPEALYAILTRRAAVAAKRGRFDQADAHRRRSATALTAWQQRVTGARSTAVAPRLDVDPTLGVPELVATLAAAGRAASAFDAADVHRAWTRRDPQLAGRAAAAGGVSRVQAALDAGDVLVAYVLSTGPSPSTLFTVTRDRIRADTTTLPIDLGERIDRFALALAADQPARATAQALGRLLLPMFDSLSMAATRRVFIVADGPVHRLAFDALVIGQGQRLMDAVEVVRVPQANALVARPRPTPSGPAIIAAFGNPSRPDDARHAPLPHAEQEAALAASVLPGSILRTGLAASRRQLRALPMDRVRVLHLAAHATVDDHGDAATALHLASADGDPGDLGPTEIAALPLTADLVVLAGCRTNGGMVLPHEGQRGLTAAFLRAGARNVLATHWAMADDDFRPVMQPLYAALARGAAVSTAVREARLAARRAGHGPKVWAALALVGDGRGRLGYALAQGRAQPPRP